MSQQDNQAPIYLPTFSFNQVSLSSPLFVAPHTMNNETATLAYAIPGPSSSSSALETIGSDTLAGAAGPSTSALTASADTTAESLADGDQSNGLSLEDIINMTYLE